MATNRSLPPCGEIMLLKEIIRGDKALLNGKSISIIGRLMTHDLVNCCAGIESVEGDTAIDEPTALAATPSAERLDVDTRLIEPIKGASIGSIYQFIGELSLSEDSSQLLLQARVARCVDGMNVDWYCKGLQLQREYFAERTARIRAQVSRSSEKD